MLVYCVYCKLLDSSCAPHGACQSMAIDGRVRKLYKQFLILARDYPEGLQAARNRLKSAFRSTPAATQEELRTALLKGGVFRACKAWAPHAMPRP
jgi:hypothetical protein